MCTRSSFPLTQLRDSNNVSVFEPILIYKWTTCCLLISLLLLSGLYMCVSPGQSPSCSTLSEVLILPVSRPLLISLGELLLITPHSNLLLFHLGRQIGRIKKGELGRRKERKEEKKKKKSSLAAVVVDPLLSPRPLCRNPKRRNN